MKSATTSSVKINARPSFIILADGGHVTVERGQTVESAYDDYCHDQRAEQSQAYCDGCGYAPAAEYSYEKICEMILEHGGLRKFIRKESSLEIIEWLRECKKNGKGTYSWANMGFRFGDMADSAEEIADTFDAVNIPDIEAVSYIIESVESVFETLKKEALEQIEVSHSHVDGDIHGVTQDDFVFTSEDGSEVSVEFNIL